MSTVSDEPSPQSIVTVCGAVVSRSVNWPVRVIVSPPVKIGVNVTLPEVGCGVRTTSDPADSGAVLLTVTAAISWPSRLL